MMTVHEKINRPPYRFVEITKRCRYGKPGDRVQFSAVRADQVVESGVAKEVADQPTPRRAKPLPENKSLGSVR